MSKPYSNSSANPEKAQARIRTMLHKFGVKRFAWLEDSDNHTVAINLYYKEAQINLPVNYDKLAAVFMKDDPYTSRKRKDEDVWEEEHRESAHNAAYSLLEDYIRSSLSLIEIESFSFEEAFLSRFMDAQGKSLGMILVPQVEKYLSDQQALKGGDV